MADKEKLFVVYGEGIHCMFLCIGEAEEVMKQAPNIYWDCAIFRLKGTPSQTPNMVNGLLLEQVAYLAPNEEIFSKTQQLCNALSGHSPEDIDVAIKKINEMLEIARGHHVIEYNEQSKNVEVINFQKEGIDAEMPNTEVQAVDNQPTSTSPPVEGRSDVADNVPVRSDLQPDTNPTPGGE